MARLKLKTLILDQFKGVTHAEYTFGDRSRVTGENAAGKTTLADSWVWLMTDKDYSLKSNPEVHPDFMEESEPSVTAVCDIDGKEITLRKFQKDSRTRKQVESGAPVRISNQYEVNSVPKSMKDFVSALEEYGVDVDTFLLLSHPEIFTSQKSTDCRKILFGMVSDITDKEIADSLSGCEELSDLLDNYKADEIAAMKKRELKEASENLKIIPEQIIGMERSKVDIDVSEFQTQKQTLQEEVAALEEKIMELRITPIGELNQTLVRLERENKALTAEANSERVAKLTEANAIIGDLKIKLKQTEAEKERLADTINNCMAERNANSNRFEELASEFQKTKASEFDPTDKKCPYCGQDLPVHEIDKMAKKFEEDKREKMNAINKEAARVGRENRELGARIPELQKQLSLIDGQIQIMQEDIEKRCQERAKLETPIDASGTPESKEILRQIAEIHHKMNMRDELQAQEDKLYADKRDLEYSIRELDSRIAEARVNDRIDKQIAEAKQKQKEYAQAEANAQKILDQLAEVSMQKNKMLTDQVNSHFKIVRFQLFKTMKNGEVVDCCIPLVKSNDGTFFKFGESANTALEVRGKLDIISGLQKFYDQHLPVFLDGAEALDSDNMAQIHMDTQLITLSVSDEPLTVSSES